MTQHSSFGPGIYSNFDTQLRIARKDTGEWEVILFDPSSLAPLILTDNGSGVFKGFGWNFISGLQFRTGAGGTGSNTATPTSAGSGVLTTFDGRTLTFDLFDPNQTIPSPWTRGDIGGPELHGTTGYDTTSNTFSVSAAGSDIWGTDDAFGYVYQAISGNTTITTRVASLATYRGLAADGTDPWAKAGVMVREGLDTNAKTVNLFVSGANGVGFHSRTTTGGTMVADGIASGAVPKWLRLNRTGNVFTGSASSDGVTWTTVFTKTIAMNTAVYVGLSVTSKSSATLSDANFDNVSLSGTAITPSSSWPAPTTAPYAALALAGRLAAVTDRNGYSVNIAYITTWTPTQLAQSPERQWQMASATDAYGRTIGFTYNSTQVSGRWVLGSITMPNGSTVSYTYSGGYLTGVSYPDGTASSFTYGWDVASGLTKVHFDDAGSDTTHRRKDVYLTNNFTTSITEQNTYHVYNQASNLIRLMIHPGAGVGGADEVAYFNMSIGLLTVDHYEGSGKVKRISKSSTVVTVSNYLTGWTFSTTTGVSGTLESAATIMSYTDDSMYRQGTPSSITTDQGITMSYSYDGDGYPINVSFGDGTSINYNYNGFKQIYRMKDRIQRVKLFSYDAKGNQTQREEGIVIISGTDTHVVGEYAHFDKFYVTSGYNHDLLDYEVDALGNHTSYTYSTSSASGFGDNHLVASITTPNDAGTGTITGAQFTYDHYGRKHTATDALGRQTTIDYDARDRKVKITYPDTSTELTIYDTGSTDYNLVTKWKDRQGSLTEYAYDAAGRIASTTTGAHTMNVTGTVTTAVSDPSVAVATVCHYLDGTVLKSDCSINGNLTTYTYDFRQRPLVTTRYATATVGLASTNLYVDNYLRQVTDPYGRNSYYNYRTSDARLIRMVQGLIPADTTGGYTATPSLARSGTTTNPPYLITDYGIDAEGQSTDPVNPRNFTTHNVYDSRGRLTDVYEAYGVSGVQSHAQTTYDVQSNVTAIYSPRWFVSGDTNGYHADSIAKTYTHRNLLKDVTTGVGSAVSGTTSYTYFDDGRLNQTTDELSKTWLATWGKCCARLQGQLDPSVTLPGAGSATTPARTTRFNDAGDLTHGATVTQYVSSDFPTTFGGANISNVTDANTLTEVTNAYDARHRKTFRTEWFAALGSVDANNPPIAGQGGILASLGLTTTIRYDDNLTDAVGLSNTTDPQSVAPYLSGLGLGTNAVGSAMVIVNPAGEPRWTIMDGLGRVVRVVDGNGNATTTTYDVVDGTTTLLTTTVTDALSHADVQYADGAGRVRIQQDQLGKRTTLGYDANGNLASQRDPTSVGQDSVFDARNRRTQSTDTAPTPVSTSSTYDANNNVATNTDGLSHTTTLTYDARDRKATTLDRLSGTTYLYYDARSSLVQITDAEGRITTYGYDPRGLLNSEMYPAGSATPNSPTTGPFDLRSYAYDGARRLATRTDQMGLITTYLYDFISRLTARNYNNGTGGDIYSYDSANRVTGATNNHYGVAVTRSYTSSGEKAGLLRTETQAVSGVPLSVGYAYDAANRVTAITYPDGSTVARTYTARNQLATVQLASATIAGTTGTPIAYDDAGRRTSMLLGNGLTETRTYFSDGMVHTITEGTSNSVENLTYAYDANKRVTGETNGVSSNDTQGFGYDNENRVTSWTTTPASQTWSLSLVGDWTSTNRTGTGSFTQARTPWPVHEINTIQQTPAPPGVPTTPVAETSDAKGNLTIDRFALQGYQWDEENRLMGASVLASGTNARQGDVGTYEYDALGRRLQKMVANLTTTYVHDGAQVVAEYEAPTFVSAAIGGATAGTLSFAANGVVTLTGGGTDIGGTSDAFQYAYQQLAGDGGIVVQVTGLTNTHASAKAGLMLRQGTTANAPNALLAVTPGIGVTLQSRGSTGGTTTTTSTVAGQTAPIWLRMVKTGTSVLGQYSPDGVTWTTVGTATVTLSAPVEIGLAVTSHNVSSLTTATFSNYVHAAPVATAGTQTLARRYVYGSYVDEPLALVNGSGTYYYAANRVYSVVALTNSSGAVSERYRYDTYGVRTVLDASSSPVVGNVSTVGNQVGFTGRYLDQETGLSYFRMRYYDGIKGRFLSRDPYKAMPFLVDVDPWIRLKAFSASHFTYCDYSKWMWKDRFAQNIRLFPGDGYQNGYSLYNAYFIPGSDDPFGENPLALPALIACLADPLCAVALGVAAVVTAVIAADTASKAADATYKACKAAIKTWPVPVAITTVTCNFTGLGNCFPKPCVLKNLSAGGNAFNDGFGICAFIMDREGKVGCDCTSNMDSDGKGNH